MASCQQQQDLVSSDDNVRQTSAPPTPNDCNSIQEEEEEEEEQQQLLRRQPLAGPVGQPEALPSSASKPSTTATTSTARVVAGLPPLPNPPPPPSKPQTNLRTQATQEPHNNSSNSFNSARHHHQQQHQQHRRNNNNTSSRPLILITDSNSNSTRTANDRQSSLPRASLDEDQYSATGFGAPQAKASGAYDQPQAHDRSPTQHSAGQSDSRAESERREDGAGGSGRGHEDEGEDENFEVVDGIRYRIVAAVTKPHRKNASNIQKNREDEANALSRKSSSKQTSKDHLDNKSGVNIHSKFSSMRRKSSAFVSNLLNATFTQNNSSENSNTNNSNMQESNSSNRPTRRMSIYEMTKSPPPETSLEIYLSERRRSSTVSSKQVQQQIAEQQSTFETNYCQRQQYFKDLNQKLINQDKKFLNVVANRGQMHRHSVDIAQLPLQFAQAKAGVSATTRSSIRRTAGALSGQTTTSARQIRSAGGRSRNIAGSAAGATGGSFWLRQQGRLAAANSSSGASNAINQSAKASGKRGFSHGGCGASGNEGVVAEREEEEADDYYDDDTTTTQTPLKADIHLDRGDQSNVELEEDEEQFEEEAEAEDVDDYETAVSKRLVAIRENKSLLADPRGSIASRSSGKRSQIVIRKFQKLDESLLSSTPAPDVKIGQRVAYKEYYGNEFGTIRWIGRVPQICPDWTVGVEFDNAIGEGDGSLNGRRYFIAKDCFAKFLPLESVQLVDQHVGRPEPGTMISVMSAAVRPGQMISIQRVSTVHVQHCFLNAPHRKPGADILAVNTRLHCQCPNCGPCAHVIKPPRTQRLARSGKNATHMCQFSTYTCCGMESQEETMCTYEGNKVVSLPPPPSSSSAGLPPVGNSWIEGSGYLTNLQFQQSKLMPEEYRLGAAPEDIGAPSSMRRNRSRTSSRRGSGRHRHHRSNSSKHDAGGKSKKSRSVSQSPINPCSPDTRNAPDKLLLPTGFDVNNMNSMSPQPPVASPESSAIAMHAKDPDYYYGNKRPESNTDDWTRSANRIIESNKSKVMHRDSIENRYLFPTDESMGSTIEHDLENLSQARYGHCAIPNSNGSSSKNILIKSLRSLVSCLSTQNNNSELGMSNCSHNEGRATSTIKYSEDNKIIVKPDNKSTPINLIELDNEMLYSEYETFEHLGQHNKSIDESYIQPEAYGSNNFKQSITRKETHAYSSSDCGFSSASQNSINIQNPVNNSNQAQLTNADAKVYERIISKLINSSSLNYEDTQKLRSILSNGHNDQCCLHNKSALNQYTSNDIDQIIADIIKNSLLEKEANNASTQRPTQTTCCQMTNNSLKNTIYADVNDKTISNRNRDKSREGFNKYCQNECCRHSPRSPIDGSTAESVTISSNDSTNGSIGPSDNLEQKNVKIETRNSEGTTNLPKAFELKLTLSINNSDKMNASSSTDDIDRATTIESLSSSVAPKVEIDIKPEPINGDAENIGKDSSKLNEVIYGSCLAQS